MKLKYSIELDSLRVIDVGIFIHYHAQITILGYQLVGRRFN